jgi:tRNA(Ile)-lysidine synthase
VGTLTDSVEQAVAGGLLSRGSTVLVACSGGADSVALAVAVCRCPVLRCAIGHVDHGLRTESVREADRVRALAAGLGAPFFVERLEGLRVRGPGLEAAAREGRYAALARLAQQAGAACVATAHTRRDQAETLLLRLIRGAGPGALAGVRKRRALAPGIELVRPLLDVPRAATEAFCREEGFAYTDDPHNSDPARARARLRALWPTLLQLNPRLEEALCGAAASSADEDDLLSGLAAEAGKDLHTEAVAALHPALLRRVLLGAALEAGVHPERQHLEALRELLETGRGSRDLPGGRALLEGGLLRFEGGLAPPRRQPVPPPVAVPGPGSYAWQSRELLVASGDRLPEALVVDLARAPFPWTLRGHRPGDRFRPAGGRTKKVADLWIDAHIPRDQRTSLAVLEDARGEVFWVEGLREGEPARGDKASPASFQWCRK